MKYSHKTSKHQKGAFRARKTLQKRPETNTNAYLILRLLLSKTQTTTDITLNVRI